jgi:hypothetical protein
LIGAAAARATMLGRTNQEPRMPRTSFAWALALAVAGCASGSGPHQSAQDVDERLHRQLASEIDARLVTVQEQGDAVTIGVADPSLFAPGTAELSDAGRGILTGVIEALVDPSLLRIQVAAPSGPGAALAAARAQVVTLFLMQPTQYQVPGALAPAVQPPVPMAAARPGAADQTAITVRAIAASVTPTV